ncbi:MAG: 50S ribosomal protein L35 [Nitrospiraceae bacterium]|nr:50S ribosomal protein L35 [Nitrospiraceae bacterium]
MPKQKSHRGAAKRFKLTGTGKVKIRKGYKSHLLTSKSRKRKRNLAKSAILGGKEAQNIKRLLNA